MDGAQEENWRGAGRLTLADAPRRLEPVHPRHLDVEQDGGELFVTHQPERIWWVVTAVGIATALLLWVYDKTLKPATASS